MTPRPLLLTLILGAILLLPTAPAKAQLAGQCAVPPGLGATLLYPYFEVDVATANGKSTSISFTNSFGFDTLARVVLWTDWGVPTLAFDVWLDGLDVQTISLRSVLDGNIPSTGMGQDLSGFDNCDTLAPTYGSPALDATQIEQLQADHRGIQGPSNLNCVGEAYGDDLARGYVTVDVVDQCSGLEAGNPSVTPANADLPYFSTGDVANGVATNTNSLWGDVVFIDFDGKAAQGSNAVSVWASDFEHPGPDAYTFYGRFHNWDGRDHRVPLPSRWEQRFLNGGVFGGGGSLIVWRDPEIVTAGAPCGMLPAPFPLADTSMALDEEATLYELGTSNFPLATQRTSIDSLGIAATFGWLQVDTLLESGQLSQAWIETTLTASAFELSAAWTGTPISFLCGLDPTSEP